MRYMLINVSNSNLQVDLFDPKISHKNKSLHRVAPIVALSLKKGEGVDILPYFKGSLEMAHDVVLHSKNALRLLKPSVLNIFVCDDAGKEVNVDKLLGREYITSVGLKKIKENKLKAEQEADKIAASPPAVKVEEPKVEEPKVEEPKVEEPKVEEPKVEEPKVEEPKIEFTPVKMEEEKTDKKKPIKKAKR